MEERTVRIKRAGGFHDYRISDGGLRTLLDALETIRSSQDQSLAYRHSCHHGSCGTCGALVNGAPRLLCLTTLRELPGDLVVLEPLPCVLHIGDLAVHPGPLFRDIPVDAPHKRSEGVSGSYERLEDCIECGLCVAACPVGEPFIGPAALAAIHRSRELDARRGTRMLDLAAAPNAVAACRRVFACSRACPTGVEPGRRIQELRSALAAAES